MKAFTNSRLVPASSQEIFRAFEDPALLARWWGPAGFTNTFNLFEFKPGGKWSFVMHGPDGTDYQNENEFQEIVAPNKVVIRHHSKPLFTLTVSIEDTEGGARVSWHQDFDDEKFASSMAHILTPANEQNLDKLQAVVCRR